MAFLDPILSPLLQLPIFWGIFIISLLISLIIIVIYKYTTDQTLMKQLKEDIKKSQKSMKDIKDNPSKMMEIQKQAMEKNMQYMMHSFKPTLFTIIPIILIFGWLNGHLAYEPIKPDQEFTTTIFLKNSFNPEEIELITAPGIEIINNKTVNNNQVTYTLKGDEGDYLLEYKLNDKSYTQELKIANKREYKPLEKVINDENIEKLRINNQKVIVLNLFGWQLGWLGTYIILSIVFSIVLRKLFKVY